MYWTPPPQIRTPPGRRPVSTRQIVAIVTAQLAGQSKLKRVRRERLLGVRDNMPGGAFESPDE
eukprot:6087158-Prymnesium_polylepis.1